MIGKTVAAGLTAEEQMILFNLVVESGAIERIKSIALHEVNHFHLILEHIQDYIYHSFCFLGLFDFVF